jgi:hypothetical protein
VLSTSDGYPTQSSTKTAAPPTTSVASTDSDTSRSSDYPTGSSSGTETNGSTSDKYPTRSSTRTRTSKSEASTGYPTETSATASETSTGTGASVSSKYPTVSSRTSSKTSSAEPSTGMYIKYFYRNIKNSLTTLQYPQPSRLPVDRMTRARTPRPRQKHLRPMIHHPPTRICHLMDERVLNLVVDHETG